LIQKSQTVSIYPLLQVLEAEVELTSILQGAFRFYICPQAEATSSRDDDDLQVCLMQHPLPLAVDSGSYEFTVPPQDGDEQFQSGPPDGKQLMRVSYQLPPDMTCAHCLILWRLVFGTPFLKNYQESVTYRYTYCSSYCAAQVYVLRYK
jgi:hypothetical protein